MTPVRLRVAELRKAKGLSQVALAERAGIARSSLIALEAGETKGIDFATLEAIANALEVDAGYLIVHDRPARRGK